MKKILIIVMCTLLCIILISCSKLNIEEVKQNAKVAFDEQNYTEFSEQLNILFKEKEEEGIKYYNEIATDDLFDISKTTNYVKTRKIYEAIAANVPKMSEDANVKLLNMNYEIEISKLVSNINSQIVEKFDEPINGINKIMYMLTSLEAVRKTISDYDQILNDISNVLLDIEDLQVPTDKQEGLSNLSEELNTLKKALENKKNYIDKNKVDIIASTQLSLDGNIIATLNTKDLNGEYTVLENEVKNVLNELKNRIDRMNQ